MQRCIIIPHNQTDLHQIWSNLGCDIYMWAVHITFVSPGECIGELKDVTKFCEAKLIVQSPG